MSIISTASEKDVKFIADHEGFVSKAYFCPAGVLTIGYGFTMRSKVFAAYWKAKKGRGLKTGDTITREEAQIVLNKMIDEEYGADVAAKTRPQKQHQFGAATSVSFNCGVGSLTWKWAKALYAGTISEAAKLLRTTAVTANGKKLDGLVKRRANEAALLEYGIYSHTENHSESTASEAVIEYQDWLYILGYLDADEVDGVPGKVTKAAVEAFQKAEGNLLVDGKVGPATRAALIRAVDAKRAGQASAGGGVVTGGGTATVDAAQGGFDWSTVTSTALTVIIVVAVIAIGFALYNNRGKLTGERVPT
jgi:lysozyme